MFKAIISRVQSSRRGENNEGEVDGPATETLPAVTASDAMGSFDTLRQFLYSQQDDDSYLSTLGVTESNILKLGIKKKQMAIDMHFYFSVIVISVQHHAGVLNKLVLSYD